MGLKSGTEESRGLSYRNKYHIIRVDHHKLTIISIIFIILFHIFNTLLLKDTICDFFVRLVNISEMDTLVNAFMFMTKHAEWDQLFHKPSKKVTAHGASQARQFAAIYQTFSVGQMIPWPYMDNCEESIEETSNFSMPEVIKYPVMLALAGSNLFVAKVSHLVYAIYLPTIDFFPIFYANTI